MESECFNENGPSKCTSGENYICISVLRVTQGSYCHKRPVYKGSSDQAPFVQKLDSAIHRINHYSVDKCQGKQSHYPLDKDLSNF